MSKPVFVFGNVTSHLHYTIASTFSTLFYSQTLPQKRHANFYAVPGAWHGPECFEPVANVLKQSGYDSTYITLKSVGATPPVKGFEPDVELVRNSVQQLLDEGKDVVLVMHSYGGAPGQQAAGELKESKGKLIRMAWITAFVFQEGQTLMAMLGGNPLPWFIVKVFTTLLVWGTRGLM